MSESRFRAERRRLRRSVAGAATLALTVGSLSGCQFDPFGATAAEPSSNPSASSTAGEQPAVKVVTHLGGDRSAVPVDRQVRVSATGARLISVRVSSAHGELRGALSGSEGWVAGGRLEPGTDYGVEAVVELADGSRLTRSRKFHTQDLTLDQQTYASIAPLEGETVGVGMPVIVRFDVPVTDRAALEKHMTVSASPRQVGSWHWLDNREVHWRPKDYWQAGTDVVVDVDINSVAAGPDLYGQESRHVEFHVGDAHIYRVDARTDQMKVYSNGTLLRTLPVTTGKPGFTTRSGVKVIIEKFASKRMNSETVGINSDDPEFYDIEDVQWAMRVTYSGEFIHAAPWSVAAQGTSNVSHGCTGMSTADAGWLYAMTIRGDVVEYTGTDRPMTLENGFGDWNASFAEYRAGSAL